MHRLVINVGKVSDKDSEQKIINKLPSWLVTAEQHNNLSLAVASNQDTCFARGPGRLSDDLEIVQRGRQSDMSNLKAYLAEKYMSGPKADVILAKTAPQKKKKRKAKAESSGGGMLIRDDDESWADARKEEEEDIAEAVIDTDRGFKKRKVAGSLTESNWVTVQDGIGGMQVKEESPPPAADEQPVVVADVTAAVGGLMNPKELQKLLPQNNVIDGTSNMTEEEIARAQETVYRDSSGKMIDTKAAKAEAARLKREKEEREAKKMEWGKGLVQRDEADKRRRELEKHKTTTFARYADDKDLNEELKAREAWNDPAASFLTVGVPFPCLQIFLTTEYFRKKKRDLGNRNTQGHHHLPIGLV